MRDPKTALKFGAFAIAQSIKADTLDERDLSALETKLAACPFPEDPLPSAVAGFLRQLRAAKNNRAERCALAEKMVRYIETMNMPVPPGQRRVDFNG